MSVLDFLCDIRFHKSYVLPPNPDTGRHTPYRVSYADYGDPRRNAVVLFCGALMGTRFCYSPLDQLAKAYNVRIVHPDRPGIGGSDPVDLDKRIQTWLEMVPILLAHLNIAHVSLASHSGGDIYLINTLLTYPHLLHPATPYICFFAPWVHQSHSNVSQLRAAELLPAPLLGKFVSIVRFVNDNVIPLAGLSSSLKQGIRDSMHRSNSVPASGPAPAPIPLAPMTRSMRTRSTSLFSHQEPADFSLDDNDVVEELRNHITAFLFAECMDGISADAKLFLRNPRSVAWCSSIFWSDFDYAVLLISKLIDEEDGMDGMGRLWAVDTFHAQTDAMVGEKGKLWFDSCWLPHQATPTPFGDDHKQHLGNFARPNSFRYSSQVVEGAEHNYLMDPGFGASEVWLQRVRDAFPVPLESRPEDDDQGRSGDETQSYNPSSPLNRPAIDYKWGSIKAVITTIRRKVRDISSRRLRSLKPKARQTHPSRSIVLEQKPSDTALHEYPTVMGRGSSRWTRLRLKSRSGAHEVLWT